MSRIAVAEAEPLGRRDTARRSVPPSGTDDTASPMGAAIHSWCVARAESKSGVRHGSKESRSLRDVCSKLHRSADDLTHAQGQREAATEYLAVPAPAAAQACERFRDFACTGRVQLNWWSAELCSPPHGHIPLTVPHVRNAGGRGMGERQGPMDLAKLLETNAQAAPHNMFAIDTGEGP